MSSEENSLNEVFLRFEKVKIMNIERRHVKSFLMVLLIFVEATIIAIILSYVIREYVGLEVFVAFFFFPEDIGVEYVMQGM